MRCASCGGVAHPATGCQYSETMIVCGPCVRRFWSWALGHTNKVYRVGPKGAKVFASFYIAAAKNRPIDNGV